MVERTRKTGREACFLTYTPVGPPGKVVINRVGLGKKDSVPAFWATRDLGHYVPPGSQTIISCHSHSSAAPLPSEGDLFYLGWDICRNKACAEEARATSWVNPVLVIGNFQGKFVFLQFHVNMELLEEYLRYLSDGSVFPPEIEEEMPSWKLLRALQEKLGEVGASLRIRRFSSVNNIRREAFREGWQWELPTATPFPKGGYPSGLRRGVRRRFL